MLRTAAILAAALLVGACGGSSRSPTSTRPPGTPIQVSSDFSRGGGIGRVHTCDGKDVSPPLRVTGLPAGTRELVAVMVDPDAPGGDFIHWGIAHLSSGGGSMSLAAGARPPGAVPGRNSFGSLGYRGPCPPAGPAHHYHITVYALAQPSDLRPGFDAGALSGLSVLGQGTLVGTYARH